MLRYIKVCIQVHVFIYFKHCGLTFVQLMMASYGFLNKTYHTEDCIKICNIGYGDAVHLRVLRKREKKS